MRWIFMALLSLASACGASKQEPATPRSARARGLRVDGNVIRDANGEIVRLRGINRSGSEYACVKRLGIFEGPVDDAAIDVMKTWNVNAVRIPLNEDCWLGINGVPAELSGGAYEKAIVDFVARLVAKGIHPILELHWSAPGATLADKQLPMPDRDHAPAFWSSVAKTFASNNGDVIFDLFNEPYPDENKDTDAAWTCWRDGGSCAGVPYPVAGMQELVSAVRSAGAHNLILLGGVQYANALSGWLAHQPTDPDDNIAAAWHVYDFNGCNEPACWDRHAGVLSRTVPIVTTEIGEKDCSGVFIEKLMTWLDARNQGYLGWVWNTWDGCLVLVKDWAGTPAGAYGSAFKAHLTR